MSLWSKLAGTTLGSFFIGGTGGAQLKHTAGAIAARNAADAAYAPLEGDLRHLGQAAQTVNDLTELNPADPAADFLLVWDTSAGGSRKVKPENLGVGGGGGGGLTHAQVLARTLGA